MYEWRKGDKRELPNSISVLRRLATVYLRNISQIVHDPTNKIPGKIKSDIGTVRTPNSPGAPNVWVTSQNIERGRAFF